MRDIQTLPGTSISAALIGQGPAVKRWNPTSGDKSRRIVRLVARSQLNNNALAVTDLPYIPSTGAKHHRYTFFCPMGNRTREQVPNPENLRADILATECHLMSPWPVGFRPVCRVVTASFPQTSGSGWGIKLIHELRHKAQFMLEIEVYL